jgi:nucleoside-diphosphate-sugar epimerase
LKILITGGSGFLGRNLVNELSKIKNYKIYVCDKIKIKFNKKNIFFTKCNLINANSFNKIIPNFDYIFHMAAELGVKNVINNPINTLNKNYISTKNVIEFAKINKKLKRIFFFSTSEVYSKLNKNNKMSETDKIEMPNIFHPRSSYWLSKILGEFLTINSKLPYTIFRVFNVYGPDIKTTHVIPSIFKKLKSKKKIIFENPGHIRCFIFINDAIKIFKLSMKTQFKNKILNVGNPSEPIKIKLLVKLTSQIINIKKNYSFVNLNNQSVNVRVPDIKRLEKLIGKKFQFIKLKDGLQYIKNQYEN